MDRFRGRERRKEGIKDTKTESEGELGPGGKAVDILDSRLIAMFAATPTNYCLSCLILLIPPGKFRDSMSICYYSFIQNPFKFYSHQSWSLDTLSGSLVK